MVLMSIVILIIRSLHLKMYSTFVLKMCLFMDRTG